MTVYCNVLVEFVLSLIYITWNFSGASYLQSSLVHSCINKLCKSSNCVLGLGVKDEFSMVKTAGASCWSFSNQSADNGAYNANVLECMQ